MVKINVMLFCKDGIKKTSAMYSINFYHYPIGLQGYLQFEIEPTMKYIISALTITVLSGCASVAGNLSSLVILSSSPSEEKLIATQVSRKVIERASIAGSDEELRLMLVEFPPKFASVAHTHPVIGLCYVIKGVAESQYEGEKLKTLHAGDSYQDSATKKHLLFRNASETDTLKFTCAAKIKINQAFMLPL